MLRFVPKRLLASAGSRCGASSRLAGGARWHASSLAEARPTVSVNGRDYKLPDPSRPVVGVCLDGSCQEYIDAALEAGCMPFWASTIAQGTGPGLLQSSRGQAGLVTGIMPSYTNPNNVSIVTGVPSSQHGVCGNYFFDEEKGEEVLMNDPSYLRCPTLLQAMAENGVRTVAVTSKDKLRHLLSHGLAGAGSGSFGVSVERLANSFAACEHELKESGVHDVDLLSLVQGLGRSPPGIYDPDNSIYCLEFGYHFLLARDKTQPALLYLSTTDYVQHKHACGTPEANDFYSKVDHALSLLHSTGAVVALTADHGMNDKSGYDGRPKVVYLADELAKLRASGRVILPITDPYVVHHGGLGSYATIYLDDQHKEDIMIIMSSLRQVHGVYSVLNRQEACRSFDLPSDRIGDIVVVSEENAVLGNSVSTHDLSQVQRLRSHGGVDELQVPMFLSKRLRPEWSRRLTQGDARNFDMFDFALNGVDL